MGERVTGRSPRYILKRLLRDKKEDTALDKLNVKIGQLKIEEEHQKNL
jgi:hypothetical protein